MSHRRRTAGHSKYGWQRYLRGYLDLLTVLFLGRYQHRPQHLFGGLGTLLIARRAPDRALSHRRQAGLRQSHRAAAAVAAGRAAHHRRRAAALAGPDRRAHRQLAGARAVPTRRRWRSSWRAPRRAPRQRGPRVRRPRRQAVTRAVAYFGTYDPDLPAQRGPHRRAARARRRRARVPGAAAGAHRGRDGDGGRRRAPGGGPGGRTPASAGAAPSRALQIDAVIVGYPGPLPRAVRPRCWPPTGARASCSTRWCRSGTPSPATAASSPRAAGRPRAVRGRRPRRLRPARPGPRRHVGARAYYQDEFGVPGRRLAVVPVGALPAPRAAGGRARRSTAGEPLTVFQYGKWSPLHGAETRCSRAADCCAASRSASCSPARDSCRRALRAPIAERGLHNVRVARRADDPAELRAQTLAADVCLGVFGRLRQGGARRAQQGLRRAGLRPAGGHGGLGRRARAAARRRERAARAGRRRRGPRGRRARGCATRASARRLGMAALALYRRALTPAVVAGGLLAALEASRERLLAGRAGGRRERRGARRGAQAPERRRTHPALRVAQVALVAATAYFLIAYLVRSWSSVQRLRLDAARRAGSPCRPPPSSLFYFLQALAVVAAAPRRSP